MAVRVDTSSYYGSYLKQPRGRGNWYFKIGNEEICFRGSYSEAKAKAIKYAHKNKNIYSIKVMP